MHAWKKERHGEIEIGRGCGTMKLGQRNVMKRIDMYIRVAIAIMGKGI